MRGTRRFKVKGKLAPRYVGLFKIISRKGEVAYHTVRSRLRFWIQQSERLIVRSLRCAKSSGVIIRKMKLPGSTKKSSKQIILNYF
jgi:hypothetical protein